MKGLLPLCSGPRCQDTTLGDVDAQTKFETTSEQSNDPPLSKVNTFGSGKDNMKILELMEIVHNSGSSTEEGGGGSIPQLFHSREEEQSYYTFNDLLPVSLYEEGDSLKRGDSYGPRGLKIKTFGTTEEINSLLMRLGAQADASKQGRVLRISDADAEFVDVASSEKNEQSTKLDDSTAGEAVTTASVEDSVAPTIEVSTADIGDSASPTIQVFAGIGEIAFSPLSSNPPSISKGQRKRRRIEASKETREEETCIDGKGKNFDEIQKLFDKEMKRVNTFMAMGSEEQESKKRAEGSDEDDKLRQQERKMLGRKKRAGNSKQQDFKETKYGGGPNRVDVVEDVIVDYKLYKEEFEAFEAEIKFRGRIDETETLQDIKLVLLVYNDTTVNDLQCLKITTVKRIRQSKKEKGPSMNPYSLLALDLNDLLVSASTSFVSTIVEFVVDEELSQACISQWNPCYRSLHLRRIEH
ncbi:hypothetical protein Tco_0991215 [Tanacetum coccineum]|uniref:Uncharacterized protein n=1 Tax=Tanacetum coccineum TaxID=301880 RepID=A0ABQ5EYL9_9ASTR